MPAIPDAAAIVVRRYARNRLYDAANRRYVTLEQIRQWLSSGRQVAVIDSEAGDDITRVLLALRS